MTVQSIFCDRCREPIVRDRSALVAECGPLSLRRPDIDLCARCGVALETWLGAPAMTHPPAGARVAALAG